MDILDTLQSNIALVNNNIEAALDKAGASYPVTLVGASKTMSRETIRLVNDNKLLNVLGENRVQELLEKSDINSNLEWHMIGTLQTNKVKSIMGKVSLIQSLDRFSLAAEINKQSFKSGTISDCLIQVNMGRELNKSGFYPEDLSAAVKKIKSEYKNISLKGIMAVMPIADEEILIELYKNLRRLSEIVKSEYGMNVLSAGMTNDYHLAIQYAHSNMVRVGRAIFGKRCNHEESCRKDEI